MSIDLSLITNNSEYLSYLLSGNLSDNSTIAATLFSTLSASSIYSSSDYSDYTDVKRSKISEEEYKKIANTVLSNLKNYSNYGFTSSSTTDSSSVSTSSILKSVMNSLIGAEKLTSSSPFVNYLKTLTSEDANLFSQKTSTSVQTASDVINTISKKTVSSTLNSNSVSSSASSNALSSRVNSKTVSSLISFLREQNSYNTNEKTYNLSSNNVSTNYYNYSS